MSYEPKNQAEPAQSAEWRERPLVNPDQESWVVDRILTAMRMALRSRDAKWVDADENILWSAMEGIANGAAIEIIDTLGMRTEFVNLRRINNETSCPPWPRVIGAGSPT